MQTTGIKEQRFFALVFRHLVTTCRFLCSKMNKFVIFALVSLGCLLFVECGDDAEKFHQDLKEFMDKKFCGKFGFKNIVYKNKRELDIWLSLDFFLICFKSFMMARLSNGWCITRPRSYKFNNCPFISITYDWKSLNIMLLLKYALPDIFFLYIQ